MAQYPGCPEADTSFGPVVPATCRGGFDFTLLFEHIFLAATPAAVFIVAAAVRLWKLRHAPTVTSGALLQWTKQCVACCCVISQVVTLALWSLPPTFRTQLSVASALLNLGASLCLCPLSLLEGKRSPRPSVVLNVYLFGAGFFDTVQVRTLWLAATTQDGYESLWRVAVASSVALGLKLVLLIVEALPKAALVPDASVSREETAGVYSLRSFWWLNSILWLGRRKKLQPADLYSIDPGLKTARYCSQLTYAWDKVDKSKKYALLLSVFSALKWPLLAPAVPRVILIGFNYAQPLLIQRALNYVAQGSSQDNNIGLGLIGATIVVYSGLAIFNGYYGYLLYRSIILVRGSLIDVIYHKSLRIELAVAQKAAPAGLVTADVERIDFTMEKLHSLWASVIELGIGVFLLQRQVGWACIAPAVIAIACTLATSVISKLLPSRQKRWNQCVQERAALTSKMMSNMKTVKMMGFSQYIATTLQAARMTELAASAGFRRCMAVVNTLVLVPKQISAPLTLTIFVLAVYTGSPAGVLSASTAFTTLAIVELITTPLALLLQTLPSLTSSLACLDRVQTYLKSPERASNPPSGAQDDGVLHHHAETLSTEKDIVIVPALSDAAMVSLQKASFAYDAAAADSPVLDAISFHVPRETIAVVAGPVGSGKSSLLKALLGELVLLEGELHVRAGRVAYCDQNPWIPNGTVQECIVGTHDGMLDGAWYDEVVYTCALEEDIDGFADGSDTNVGSRGMALSDGQKHRLALARAVYSRAPLLILDDIFRSLDPRTEIIISERLLSRTGLVKRHGMTLILATHSARALPLADQIVVIDKGGRLSQTGSFAQLSAREGYVQSLSAQQPPPSDSEAILLLMNNSSVRVSQLKLGDFLSSPPATEPAEKATRGSNSSFRRRRRRTTGGTTTLPPRAAAAPAVVAARPTRDKATYRFYFRPIGVWRVVILLLAVALLAFLTRFQRIWVEWWTKNPGQNPLYIGVYFFLAVGACMSFAFFFWWMFMFVVPVTAGGLHEQLLYSILRAPFSYFSSVDSGVILNRFTQDMAILNGQLPVNFFQAASAATLILSQIALIAYGSQYMATAVPVTLVVLWLLARFYLRTSQQLRVLDLELKAPIYTSLTETQEGLATIRAFGWQASFRRHCQARIDESKKAIYIMFMVQRWLNFVLDLVVGGLATVLMTLATQLRASTDAAALGVGLSSVIGFSVLVSQFILTYTELENSLGAISRIKDCVDNIESEEASPDGGGSLQKPPPDWPARGDVEFSHVTAHYNDNDDKPVVRDISFRARPGQRVFICGRTGSGKSTLISILLRLMKVDAGHVRVDGVDIATLSPEAVRQSVTVIPQSPFFLPGSVRLNLAAATSGVPAATAETTTDEAMMSALAKVGLWELVAARGGLQAPMSAVALSLGQQQLFALAMAMLRGSQVVVMDELTSGVDEETEAKMYALMQDEFRGCTVISVAHRLKVVADGDLVVVLSGGQCVEMGERRALWEKRGAFWQLAQG